MPSDEEIQVLDAKLKQLKLDYEQYFLGSRPREPAQLRGEVQKLFTLYTQSPIQNTAQRFRFNSLMSRFHAFRRQWDEILRKIDEGTYARHLFKANLHDRERFGERGATAGGAASGAGTAQAGASAVPGASAPPRSGAAPEPDLFERYRDACVSCGQDVSKLTRDRLDAVLKRQEEDLRQRFGCAEVRFRVVVDGGKVRLKATPVPASRG